MTEANHSNLPTSDTMQTGSTMPASKSIPTISECLQLASDTRAMALGLDALAQLPDLIRNHFGSDGASPGGTLPGEAFLVADGNTMQAAGLKVQEILKDAGIQILGSHIYPAEPRLHADYAQAKALGTLLRVQTPQPGVVISVGAGTVNDLVKRGAHEAGLPYLCVATAASVDGYTSAGSALLDRGFKRTFACPAPRVVVADSAVLAAAPAYLASSGFGDLAGKVIAGTDWLIAEAAGAAGAPGTEPIDAKAWAMTQTGLEAALIASEGAHRGDGPSLETLFEALALTGFAMQYTRSSRPVSGCEHLISHVWEMADLSVGGVPVTHGHKVAIGTLCAAAFTELLFRSKEPPRADPRSRPTMAAREAEVREAFRGRPALEETMVTALEKLMPPETHARMAEALRDQWGQLRTTVLSRLPPYDELRDQLARAGCPVCAEDIGLAREEAIGTARLAQMIRNRYTVLDLGWDLGAFDGVLEAMEADYRYLSRG
jgi:glycerol-1-phosphate dehydrogenase [NAD(P)+]